MIETFSVDLGDCTPAELFRELAVTIETRLLIRLRAGFRYGCQRLVHPAEF